MGRMKVQSLEALLRMARMKSFRMSYTGNAEQAKADAKRFAAQLAEEGVISPEDAPEVERVLVSYSVPVTYFEPEYYASPVDALEQRPGGLVPGETFS